MKVASLQSLQPLPPPPPSPAAPSASPAPAAPRREPHGHEQPPHSGPSPALPPYLTVSDVPLTPGATLTDLAAQPIAHKPAVHLSASPIATVAGTAPGPVSGLIFNHKAPVQVPLWIWSLLPASLRAATPPRCSACWSWPRCNARACCVIPYLQRVLHINPPESASAAVASTGAKQAFGAGPQAILEGDQGRQ